MTDKNNYLKTVSPLRLCYPNIVLLSMNLKNILKLWTVLDSVDSQSKEEEELEVR